MRHGFQNSISAARLRCSLLTLFRLNGTQKPLSTSLGHASSSCLQHDDVTIADSCLVCDALSHLQSKAVQDYTLVVDVERIGYVETHEAATTPACTPAERSNSKVSVGACRDASIHRIETLLTSGFGEVFSTQQQRLLQVRSM